MLDKRRLVYSCGYWKKDDMTLEEAQEAKFEIICLKLGLKPGDIILDIGCGCGGFLKYAAEKHGIYGVGITISKEQASLAKKNCVGLPIEIKVRDYRNEHGSFDHIVSIGMFEHVGTRHYKTYFQVVRECLRPGGALFASYHW